MTLEEVLAATGSQLANQALTHPSVEAEHNYQRLEFLGDAVLGAIVSHWLYLHCPAYSEGRMSWLKSWMVSEEALADVAGELGLSNHIRLGQGAKAAGDCHRPSILSDVTEALIGALFLVGGWSKASAAVHAWFAPYLARIKQGEVPRDSKSTLQELLQQQDKSFEYLLKDQQGPDHEKVFWVELRVQGKPVAVGCGSSKKEAEQKAAQQALDNGI